VNEAALRAARNNKTLVDMSDFEEAKDKVMLGVERRSLVLSEDERKLTAYHESGHTVVSLMTAGSDPIHKVTIVPRGRALGLMMSLPDKDRYGQTKEWLIGRLAICFGGRVAEELVFGPEKITTGAGSDIQQATDTARRMVTMFGMSERVGMMAVGDQEHEIFLGREMSQRRAVSERTAEIVDDEVKRFLDEAFDKARKILVDNRDLLDRIALTLLERETVDRRTSTSCSGRPLPPRPPVVPPIAPTPVVQAKPAAPALRPLLCSALRRPSQRARECHAADAPSPAALLDELRARGGCRHGNHDGGRRHPLAVRCAAWGTTPSRPLSCSAAVTDSMSSPGLTGPSSQVRARGWVPWRVPGSCRSRCRIRDPVGLALPAEIPARWQTARGPSRSIARSSSASST
jgi:hypothetical protein